MAKKLGRPKGSMGKKKKKIKPCHKAKKRASKYNDAFIKRMAEKLVPWFMASKKRFWLKDFAIEHKFWSGYFGPWTEKSEYFAEQLLLAKDIQESRLVHGGIDNNMNANMVRLALQNVAGWRDQKDVNVMADLEFNIVKHYDGKK